MIFNFYKTSTFFLLLLFFSSCSNKCVVDNIEVSELLSTVAKERFIDYCELLQIALEGNKNAITKLSLLEFNDAVGYDHGSVIVDLIIAIGETKFINSISEINKEQKELIESDIDIGLNYGNSPLKGKTLKSAFPDLYLFLKE